MRKSKMLSAVLVLGLAVSAFSAHARSLLYYYDFDNLTSNATAAGCVNRGTGTATLTQQNQSGSTLNYTTDTAFGGAAMAESSSGNALWLGDGSNSIGCGTMRGFTISFWVKITNSHGAWSDFFGFRLGGHDYRCEFVNNSNTAFTMYTSTGTATFTTVAPTANQWTHMVFVHTPYTNNVQKCEMYLNGTKAGNVTLSGAGDLQRVYIGSWVMNGNSARKYTNTNTCLDEFAIFDYPVTAGQLKWLGRYRPDQPVGGPGREMPHAFLLNTATDAQGGVKLSDNSGTGSAVAYKWVTGYSNWAVPGANGSSFRFETKDASTWRIDDNSTHGLGGTAGSGFTFSFWLMGPNTFPNLWRDFFCYRLGNRYSRFEWNAQNPPAFYLYRTDLGTGPNAAIVPEVLQNVCCVWNQAVNGLDVYVSGVKKSTFTFATAVAAADAVKTFTFGQRCFDQNGNERGSAGIPGSALDDFAFFNYSFSSNQVAWISTNSPALPPMDCTALTRTVSADGKWYGHLASWTDTDNAKTIIYPSCEDLDLTAALTVAANATLANDTFVFPKELTIAKGGDSAVTLTLATEEGSRFEPQKLTLGDGVTLAVVSPLRARNDGRVDFAPGEIAGADDITLDKTRADFSATTFTDFTGKIRITGIAAHVKCRAADVANYFVYDSTVYQQTAAGTGLVVIEKSQTISLTEDTVWTDFATGAGYENFVVDLCGHRLTVGDVDVYGRIIDSVGGGELHLDIASGRTVTNYGIEVCNGIKLVKEGAGTYVVARSQSYTGGTTVSAGTLKLGLGGSAVDARALGPNASGSHAKVRVESGAALDIGSGLVAWGYHDIVLAGGTLKGVSSQPNFNLNVMADSVADFTGYNADFGTTSTFFVPKLNGHRLQVKIYTGRTLYLGAVTGPGEIYYTSGGWLRPQTVNAPEDASTRYDLYHAAALNMVAATDVRDYNVPYSGTYMAGTAALNVYGTFTPTGTSFYGCTMQDGSTVDLSSKGAVWSVTRTTTGSNMTGNGTVSFAADSEILVKLGSWASADLSQREVQVVAWTTQPAATVKFKIESSLASRWHFDCRADGLYLARNPGMIILIR